MTNRWYGVEMTKLIYEDLRTHEKTSKKTRESSMRMFW